MESEQLAPSRPITADMLDRLFSGFGEDSDRTCGGEEELIFMNPSNFSFPSDAEHEAITFKLRENDSGVLYSDEPPSYMTEIKNDVFQPITAYNAYEDIVYQRLILAKSFQKCGFQISPFACPVFLDSKSKGQYIISARGADDDYNDNPHTMMKAIEQFYPQALDYPMSNGSIHWNSATRTLKECFEKARLHAALLPALLIYMENRPPYQNNSEARILHHTGILSRQSLGSRGLLPDFLFAAKDETEFKERFVQRLLNTPMIYFYDHDGELRVSPKNIKLYPDKMKDLGAEDMDQAQLAAYAFFESFRLKGITDEKTGLVRGPIIEYRDFDCGGPEVFNNVMMLYLMIDNDDDARSQLVQILDINYGIPLMRDPETAQRVIFSNIEAALKRGYKGVSFMSTPYGSAEKEKTVQDLLNHTLIPMMIAYHLPHGQKHRLENYEYLAETGITPAQFWYNRCDNIDKQKYMTRELMQKSNYLDYWTRPHSWPQQLEREI